MQTSPPAAVEAALRQRIGAISGVHVTSVRTMPPPQTANAGCRRYHVTVHGWSPSLHLHCMDWTATVRVDQSDARVAAEALHAFARHIAVQRKRRDAGLALGTATPYNTDLLKAPVPVGHMRIDAALAELIRSSGSRPLEDVVADSVSDLHRNDLGSGLEDAIHNDDRINGLVFSSLMEVAPGAYFDGYALNVRDEVPETVRCAAVGRRLGDLVDVPGHLAGHLITSVEDEDDLHFIHVQPRLARIGDLLETA